MQWISQGYSFQELLVKAPNIINQSDVFSSAAVSQSAHTIVASSHLLLYRHLIRLVLAYQRLM